MKKNRMILLLLIIVLPVFLSGCFAKDVATDIVTPDDEKIIGCWYDQTTNAYYEFTEGGTYKMGTSGLYSENAGGFYQLEDGKLILSVTYTIVDSVMTIISDYDDNPNQDTQTTFSYEFDISNNLVLHTENAILTFKKVETQLESETDQPDYVIEGLYLDGDTSYYFDQNGGVTRTFEDKTDNGTFKQDGTTIVLTIGGSVETYSYYANNTQLILIDEDGQMTYLNFVK